jgi:hypothetical protein
LIFFINLLLANIKTIVLRQQATFNYYLSLNHQVTKALSSLCISDLVVKILNASSKGLTAVEQDDSKDLDAP